STPVAAGPAPRDAGAHEWFLPRPRQTAPPPRERNVTPVRPSAPSSHLPARADSAATAAAPWPETTPLLRPSPRTPVASSADVGRHGSALPLQLPQLPDKFAAVAAGAAGAAGFSGVFFMLVCAALLLASWGVWRLRPGEQLRFSSVALSTPERPG